MLGIREIGPCLFTPPFVNPFSWTRLSNVLFVDQPTLAGFSYSVPQKGCLDGDGNFTPINGSLTCPGKSTLGTFSSQTSHLVDNSTIGAAEGFWNTLQGFFGAFPQYSRNEVIIATESYGGHYGPIFSEYILRKNKANTTDTVEIPISSLIIINGLTNTLLQYPPTLNFTISPGNSYGLQLMNDTTQRKFQDDLLKPGQCMDRLHVCNSPNGTDAICAAVDDFCYDTLDLAMVSSKRDPYDIRYLKPSPWTASSAIKSFFNSPRVQQAIGAYVNYTMNSDFIFNKFQKTGDIVRDLTTMDDMRSLIKRQVQVVIIHGDADYLCHWQGGEAVAKAVGADDYSHAGYTNVQTQDGIVHGQVKESGGLAFVRAFDSGHMVPFYKPLLSLEIFSRTIRRRDIATGNYSFRKTSIGPRYSNHTEGNSTVQWRIVPENATYNHSLNMPNPWD
jgi:carboxypeptidase C (cathepsin A)